MSPYATTIVDSLSRAELDCDIPEYYDAIFYQHIHRFRNTNLTYGNGFNQISEKELLSIFEDTPEPDVNVTKKARVDDRRSVPTATEPMQPVQPHQPRMHVHQPTATNVQHPGNHVTHMQHPQYSYPATNGHHNPSMYYTPPMPYVPQQQYAHNYAAPPMMSNTAHAQGTLNLSLDYEDVIETGPPSYQPPRSDPSSNGFNNYPYYPHTR